jgi:hypothetical protein
MVNSYSRAYCKKYLVAGICSCTVHLDSHKINQVLLTSKKKRLFYCQSGKSPACFTNGDQLHLTLKKLEYDLGVNLQIAWLCIPAEPRFPIPCPLSLPE